LVWHFRKIKTLTKKAAEKLVSAAFLVNSPYTSFSSSGLSLTKVYPCKIFPRI